MGEWYYIGHYGQLGPLTLDQLVELIEGDVIARDTYVWRVGMSEWVLAGKSADLVAHFRSIAPTFDPPPPPTPQAVPRPQPTDIGRAPVYSSYPRTFATLKSDKNRVLAGILQILFPGVGRMYLGYAAIGIIQLITWPCGVGAIWGLIDGIIILAGGLKMDGYGRYLG